MSLACWSTSMCRAKALERLARGMTPAKLVSVVSRLSSLEITFAYSKMRQRRTPGNQAHVTNAKDDPLQLAADAAVAVALGFDEIETTMRVASNSWANALACAVGASVGRGGVLFQCSIEEAEELRIGMAGFTSYAETVSVYGTEAAFVDGDDTPWSKAFLTAAYASRGIKARCTSGASAELLMGFHERQSVLYLEARCLCLQRAMGVQGTQNGGIDGAPLTVSMAGGMRELMAENLIAVWLGLECASGNDTRVSESEIRVGAKITPYLMAGSDLLCSGFGSIRKYDNSFNPSLFNGEDIEDFLALQRDLEADGGLTPIEEVDMRALRMRAIRALAAVFEELNLAKVPEAWIQSVAAASGSLETETFATGEVTRISEAIRDRGLTAVDVVRALETRGFGSEAENLLLMLRQRISGDYLQTSAILRDGKVISALNDPNDYRGPGSGYRMSEARWEAVRGVRDQQTREKVLERERRVDSTAEPWLIASGEARKGIRSARGGDRPQPRIRQRTDADDRRPRPDRRGAGADRWCARSRRRASARAHSPHRRHVLPRPDGGAPFRLRLCHRYPGQGHRRHPPRRPAAAHEHRAVLERASDDARPLPRHGPQRRAVCLGCCAGAGPGARRRPGARRALSCARRHALRDRDGTGGAGRSTPSMSSSPSASEGLGHDLPSRPLSAVRERTRTGRIGIGHAARQPDARRRRVAAGRRRRHPDLGRRAATSGRHCARMQDATGLRSTSNAPPTWLRSRRT